MPHVKLVPRPIVNIEQAGPKIPVSFQEDLSLSSEFSEALDCLPVLHSGLVYLYRVVCWWKFVDNGTEYVRRYPEHVVMV